MAKRTQTGFTIVELMIATAIFSIILLLCTFGLLQIGRTYYRGVTTSRTQDTARKVIDTLSQSIQYGTSVPAAPPSGVIVTNGSPSSGQICFGEKRFTYFFNKPVTGNTQHALQLDSAPSGCTGPVTASAQELLGENMRLTRFSLIKKTTGYEISLKVSHGEDEDLVLLPPNTTGGATVLSVDDEKFGNCQIQARAEYCASAELTVTVQRRLPD